MSRQKGLDALYPTIVRYLGIAVVIFYALGRSFGLDVPDAALVAAAGMIGYKTVKNASNGNGGKNEAT